MIQHVILVFDSAQRSALSATRSLGKRADCKIINCDSTSEALAGISKFSDEYLQHPDPIKHQQEFVEWVKKVIDEYQVTCLFPLTEIVSRILISNRDTLPCALPFPSLEKVLTLSDKNNLMQLADSLNLPIPETTYYENAHFLSKSSLDYPCVVKPSLSRVLINEEWVMTQVVIVKSEQELRQALEEHSYLFSIPFMTQSFIEGYGAGIFAYYQNGKSKAFFSHKRIREKPPQGGVSVLCESVAVETNLLNVAKQLLDSVEWHGVAMVEFRVSKNGTPYLMEVNTRLWGSLQLSIDSGVDFPSLLLDGEAGEVCEVHSYETGVQLRWLLGDLDSLYIKLKSPEYSNKEKINAFVQFFIPRFRRRNHEINRLSDMKPFWYELKNYFR